MKIFFSLTSHLSKSELRKKSTTVWKFQDKPQWVNTGIILTINGKWTEIKSDVYIKKSISLLLYAIYNVLMNMLH